MRRCCGQLRVSAAPEPGRVGVVPSPARPLCDGTRGHGGRGEGPAGSVFVQGEPRHPVQPPGPGPGPAEGGVCAWALRWGHPPPEAPVVAENGPGVCSYTSGVRSPKPARGAGLSKVRTCALAFAGLLRPLAPGPWRASPRLCSAGTAPLSDRPVWGCHPRLLPSSRGLPGRVSPAFPS